MQFPHDGILVVDKPPDMSSAQVVGVLKKSTRARKVGHAGTLDPFATGVLVCCINSGTKLARYLLSGRKSYAASMRLGIETDTQDATGRVLDRTDVPDYPAEQITAVLQRFQGESMQVPPAYSALKHRGTPLYKLARRGVPVVKPARRIQVTAMELVHMDLPEIDFRVTCSSGTYVRTLCADIGRHLGCGGHLKRLCRTRSSGFTLDQAIDLETARSLAAAGTLNERMVPLAQVLPEMPEHIADKVLTEKIKYGRMVTFSDMPPAGADNEEIKILDSRGRLRAIVRPRVSRESYDYCCVFPVA